MVEYMVSIGLVVMAALWAGMVLQVRIAEGCALRRWRHLHRGAWPAAIRCQVIGYVQEHYTVEDVERRLPWLPSRAGLTDYLRWYPVSITEAFLADWLVYRGMRLTRVVHPEWDEVIQERLA